MKAPPTLPLCLVLVSAGALGCDGRRALKFANDAVATMPPSVPSPDATVAPPSLDAAAAPPGSSPPCAGRQVEPTDGWIVFDSLRDGNRDIYAVRPGGCDLRRLTNEPSMEMEPAVSPDGRLLAFASDREGTIQVFVRDLASGQVARLTSRPEGAYQPAWRPDGRWLAFSGPPGIFLVQADGTDAYLLTSSFNAGQPYGHPSFDSDGRRLLYDRYNEIGFLSTPGGDFRPVFLSTTTAVQAPSLSRDGRSVACQIMCEPGTFSLWQAPAAETTDPCRGGVRLARGRRPSFGPGDLIAFELIEDNGAARIALIRAGGEPVAVTSTGHDDRNPSWAPAGTSLPTGL